MLLRILKSVAILSVLLAGAANAQERVVNVYNWSDYIDPKVLEDFTKETGIKVRYDTFDSNEIVEAKLLAGKTGYDVVVPGSTVLRRLVSVGLFQKLDKSKIPNLTNAWPEITQRLAIYDPGNEYAVNYMWGTTGIGYNVAKVKERLGNTPIDSWDIFFKPENLAKLRSCGVHVLDGPEEVLPAALKYLGFDPDSKNAAEIEKAGELLVKLRPNIQKFHSSEYLNALANGEICLVLGWSGDVFQAKARAKEAAEKTKKPVIEIEYIVPKEGAQIFFDSFSIPKDAPNADAAHVFINFMMRPDIAARNTNFVSYANGNLASQKSIDKDIIGNPAIYPPADVLKRLYTVTPYPAQLQRTVTRVWTRVKTGR